MKKWVRPLLFGAGGAAAGYLYYRLIGCTTGTCPISSNPYLSMIYLGVVGLLLSEIFRKPNQKGA